MRSGATGGNNLCRTNGKRQDPPAVLLVSTQTADSRQ